MLKMLIDFAHYGPETCLQILPKSRRLPLTASMVCGVPLPHSEEQRLFLDTGLIHLMVVSGAHLAFLELFVKRWPKSLQLSFLGFYSWLTGWQPPIVRAFTRRCLQTPLSKLGMSGLQIDALTSMALICVHPGWLLSRSFLMSWLCGLAMLAPLGPIPLRCYLFLFPFAPSAPVSLFWNVTLTPLLGNLLFPLCLLSVVLPFLSWAVDLAWDLFLMILQMGPQAPPQLWFLETRSLFWLPLTLHILLLLGEVPWRRAFAFSSAS